MRGKAFYKALRSRFRVSYNGVSECARITSLRRYPARSSGFYRPLRFVLASSARAGDSRLEDKVLREFCGLAPFGKRAKRNDPVRMNGARAVAADKYISGLNPALWKSRLDPNLVSVLSGV